MRLVFLAANQKWAIVFGETLCRFYDRFNEAMPLFYSSREEAIEVLLALGFTVDSNNNVIGGYRK